jgi:hypothetical protein
MRIQFPAIFRLNGGLIQALNGLYVSPMIGASSISGVGDFTGGVLTWYKLGRIACVKWTSLTYPSNSAPTTGIGLIPSDFCPPGTVRVVFDFGATGVYRASVTSTGAFTITSKDSDGNLVNKTSCSEGSFSFMSNT